MASLDDEDLDLHKLKKELCSTVAADQEYRLRNDAKIRAMQQRVSSYDEFREIVNAAHLKPLQKKEKLNSKRVQPWNLQNSKNLASIFQEEVSDEKSSNFSVISSKLPANSFEFLRDWRRIKHTRDRYDLLKKCGDMLQKFFSQEFVFGLLGEFLIVASAAIEESPSEFRTVCGIMEGLSKTQGFSLAIQLFSEAEKEACQKILKSLTLLAEKSTTPDDLVMVEDVNKHYTDFKEERRES